MSGKARNNAARSNQTTHFGIMGGLGPSVGSGQQFMLRRARNIQRIPLGAEAGRQYMVEHNLLSKNPAGSAKIGRTALLVSRVQGPCNCSVREPAQNSTKDLTIPISGTLASPAPEPPQCKDILGDDGKNWMDSLGHDCAYFRSCDGSYKAPQTCGGGGYNPIWCGHNGEYGNTAGRNSTKTANEACCGRCGGGRATGACKDILGDDGKNWMDSLGHDCAYFRSCDGSYKAPQTCGGGGYNPIWCGHNGEYGNTAGRNSTKTANEACCGRCGGGSTSGTSQERPSPCRGDYDCASPWVCSSPDQGVCIPPPPTYGCNSTKKQCTAQEGGGGFATLSECEANCCAPVGDGCVGPGPNYTICCGNSSCLMERCQTPGCKRGLGGLCVSTASVGTDPSNCCATGSCLANKCQTQVCKVPLGAACVSTASVGTDPSSCCAGESICINSKCVPLICSAGTLGACDPTATKDTAPDKCCLTNKQVSPLIPGNDNVCSGGKCVSPVCSVAKGGTCDPSIGTASLPAPGPYTTPGTCCTFLSDTEPGLACDPVTKQCVDCSTHRGLGCPCQVGTCATGFTCRWTGTAPHKMCIPSTQDSVQGPAEGETCFSTCSEKETRSGKTLRPHTYDLLSGMQCDWPCFCDWGEVCGQFYVDGATKHEVRVTQGDPQGACSGLRKACSGGPTDPICYGAYGWNSPESPSIGTTGWSLAIHGDYTDFTGTSLDPNIKDGICGGPSTSA